MEAPYSADARPLRISCLQAEGVPGDIAHNLDELDRAAAQARENGSDLLITPEMFLTGYNCGPLEPLLADARDLKSAVAEIAARHRIAVLAGLPLELPDGEMGNSAIFIDDEGNVLAEHTKTHLYSDIDKTRFVPGERATTLVDYRGVRVAILICMELEYPELARAAAIAGAHVIAVLTSNMEPYSGINERLVWTRAWENRLFIAYVNRCGSEHDIHYPGLSSIYGPNGDLLDGSDGASKLLSADIDPAAVAVARQELDYLSGRRPDLYSVLTQTAFTRRIGLK